MKNTKALKIIENANNLNNKAMTKINSVKNYFNVNLSPP